MNNRITGDFDTESIEAFRAAYAASLTSPDSLDLDPTTNLPGNTISNVSPWLEHTGLWKANDGMSRDFKPNQPFNPDDYFPADDGENSIEESDSDMEMIDSEEEDFGYEDGEDPMTDEEFDVLKLKVWGEDEGEPVEDEFIGDEEEDIDAPTEEEVDALIREILGESEDEDSEDSEDPEDSEDLEDEDLEDED